MRRGFTVIEIIFVVTIVAILIGVAVPRLMEKDDLGLATDQVINHIRYTQHLALMDDKFDPDENQWFKGVWHLRFSRSANSRQQMAYTIFADLKGTADTYDGNPNPGEIGKNPFERNKLLTGGASGGGMVAYGDGKATNEMCIGCNFSIQDVQFSSSCTNNQGVNQSRRILFDEIGRPYWGYNSNTRQTNPYLPTDRYPILATCRITLTHPTQGQTIICIEPETGYTHRCD